MSKIFGIIGHNISYSLSPVIHNAWFKQYDIDAEYKVIDIKRNNLPLVTLQNLAGANITIPYKKEILKYVDNPEKWPVVNTLKFTNAGISSTNTDALAIKQLLIKKNLKGRALIIGNGGAAAAAYWALQQQKITDVTVLCRNPNRLEFKKSSVTFLDWFADDYFCDDFNIIINAVPLDAQVPSKIFKCIGKKSVVFEFVYADKPTPLITLAKAKGLNYIDGFNLLITQAQYAFNYWFNIFPEVDKKLTEQLKAA